MLTLQFGLNEGVDKIVFVTKCYQNKHDDKRYRLWNNITTKLYIYNLFEGNFAIGMSSCVRIRHRIWNNDLSVNEWNISDYAIYEISNDQTWHALTEIQNRKLCYKFGIKIYEGCHERLADLQKDRLITFFTLTLCMIYNSLWLLTMQDKVQHNLFTRHQPKGKGFILKENQFLFATMC